MVEPKVVSNLPLDVSVRWSEDQELLTQSEATTRGSALVSSLAQTEAIQPVEISLFDKFLGLSKLHPSWATFQTPPDFQHQRRQIFRTRLAPFLGSDEQQDSTIARLQNAKGEDQDRDSWEREREYFLNLYQILQDREKDSVEIDANCKRYQKG